MSPRSPWQASATASVSSSRPTGAGQPPEEERRRIARDLDDLALRDLTDAISAAQAESSPTESVDRLARLVPTLERVTDQLQSAIFDLRLAAEQDRPFPDLLRGLITRHRAIAGESEIELELGAGVPVGSAGGVGTQLLRTLGEALNNSGQRAYARHVHVRVWGRGGHLWAEVSDDGRVAPDATVASSETGQTGVTGIREHPDRPPAVNCEAAGLLSETAAAIDELTPRETEVLQGVADGLDSRAIADRLHISIRTERNHISSILAKLGVHSQVQALVFALRYGVVKIAPPSLAR